MTAPGEIKLARHAADIDDDGHHIGGTGGGTGSGPGTSGIWSPVSATHPNLVTTTGEPIYVMLVTSTGQPILGEAPTT